MTDSATLRPKLLGQYANVGFNFVLLRHWDAVSAKSGAPIGKAAVNKAWPALQIPHKKAVRHMEKGGNVGVQMGTSGYGVIDYDPRDDPNAGHAEKNSLTRLLNDIGLQIHEQARVVTGNILINERGQHIYLKIDPDWRGRTKLPKENCRYPGIEFKHGRGQQVVAAGSKHPSGGIYHWNPKSRALKDACDAPPALREIFKIDVPAAALRKDGRESWGAFDVEKAAKALNLIDPCKYGKGEHESWFELMCAFHWMTGGQGGAEWCAWCAQDPQYTHVQDDVLYRWDTLRVDHASPIRAGVFFRALEREEIPKEKWPTESVEFLFDDVPDSDWEIVVKPEDPESRVLKTMNERHAFLLIDQKPLYLWTKWDAKTESWVPSFIDSRGMREKYSNRRIMVARPNGAGGMMMKEETHFEFWQKHSERREYDGIEFDPDGDVERKTGDGIIYNLFRGWPYDPHDRGSGDWKKFRKLILRAICDDDESLLDYLLKWVAWSAQHPGDTQGICFVMRGEKGAGKGLFATRWTRLFGSAGLVTDDADDVFGRFNERMETTCALFLDEAMWAGDVTIQGKVKSRITEPTIRVEQKFMPARTVKNHLSIMMATNQEWAVPATTDERRYVVYDVKRVWEKNHAFYGEVSHEMDNNGGMQAWYYDMVNMDLSDFDPTIDYPKTDALREQVRQSVGPAVEWWIETIEEGVLPCMISLYVTEGKKADWNEESVRVPMSTLKEQFRRWLINRGMKGEWAYRFDQAFVQKMKDMLPSGFRCKVKSSLPEEDEDGEFMDMNKLGDGRVKCFEIPSLPDCRRYVRETFGDVFAEDDDLDFL